jgi:hypothetical protein
MKLSLGTVLLFGALAIGCDKKKEIPPDAEAIVAEARDQVDALEKLAGKLPASIDQKSGPECGEAKKSLVLSRTDLERVFVKDRASYDSYKDGREHEANAEVDPSGWVFPASFNPRLVELSLETWSAQRHPATIDDLRKALDSIRPIEHLVVYRADNDTEGGCMSCGPEGTFRPATLKALAIAYDKKTLEPVCHATLQVESAKELRVAVRSGEDTAMAGHRALDRDLRDKLRAAVEKRFGVAN